MGDVHSIALGRSGARTAFRKVCSSFFYPLLFCVGRETRARRRLAGERFSVSGSSLGRMARCPPPQCFHLSHDAVEGASHPLSAYRPFLAENITPSNRYEHLAAGVALRPPSESPASPRTAHGTHRHVSRAAGGVSRSAFRKVCSSLVIHSMRAQGTADCETPGCCGKEALPLRGCPAQRIVSSPSAFIVPSSFPLHFARSWLTSFLRTTDIRPPGWWRPRQSRPTSGTAAM